MFESVQAGSILAIRGRGFLSKGILRATGNSVSHVGLVISDDPVVLVLEALWRVKTRPIEESIEDAEAAYILTPLNLQPIEIRGIVTCACSESADGYGWWDIGLQLLDSLFRTTWFTDRVSLTALDHHPICSFLVARAYQNVGLTFGEKEASVTPADIYRFAFQHPDKYRVEKIK